jgi:hypothetical protein
MYCSIAVLDNEDLFGFTREATHPEHRVKVQVLFRCRTQDPCSWVGKGREGREGMARGGAYDVQLPMSMENPEKYSLYPQR